MSVTPVEITSEDVSQYMGMIEAHALRLSRLPLMENDFDDFVQEGSIAVWGALSRGEHPSNLVVRGRMIDWARKRSRQFRNEEPLPEELDPLLGGDVF